LQTAIEEAMRLFRYAKCVRDPFKATKTNEYDSRSIWIFTSQANPYSPDRQHLIENVVNEAKEKKMKIEVWPLVSKSSHSSEGRCFKSSFYENLVSVALPENRFHDSVEMEDTLLQITNSMRSARPSYRCPLLILREERNPAIMIDWFPIVQLAKRPGKVHIDNETKLYV
jgi:hypothetical protein